MDRLSALEKEIEDIRKVLHAKENELYELKKTWIPACRIKEKSDALYTDLQQFQYQIPSEEPDYPKVRADSGQLPTWAIERYSRQILVPDIGVVGQQRLCGARVLVVGAGGLGCPAASYLAGAGVGEIGIVDYDTVDLTNLHRQLLHGEQDAMMLKVESAANALRRINSRITVTPYNVQLDSTNALDIVSRYSIVLDCSDNVPTRYLLNDACILLKVPLISGSALKMEGQLTTYAYRAEPNANEKDRSYCGPCYRCLFPTPPPPEAVGSCAANGVTGPIPGTIGCLQALEAIKYILGQTAKSLLVGRMLLFDGEDITFRTVKLRVRNPDCAACSSTPVITELLDYETFCRMKAQEKKKQNSRLKSQRRKEEKEKRMTGQSYFGFRKTKQDDRSKWIQDVPKSGRKMGPACKSDFCAKGISRSCTQFTDEKRQLIFHQFWNEYDWKTKRSYVKSLVDAMPPKRRRTTHKGETSRKGDTKIYHLFNENVRIPVCRVMFLNTLGIKEAMVRCWLQSKALPQKMSQKRLIKSLNVQSFINSLPTVPPKCQYCRNLTTRVYLEGSVKNLLQLYNKYVTTMRSDGVAPASRKTFTKVFNSTNIGIFKPKNDNDICDLIATHNPVEDLNVNNFQNIDQSQILTNFEQW